MEIRNFSIIAHIDHGKSTFADRILELTGALSQRDLKEQSLDTMDIERERGITIKAQSARIIYKSADQKEYILNLIDTPGHVDFSYEVSRSLAACESALLLVDASQGIEAQTLANVHLALEHNLVIIPVINKIDLPSADIDLVTKQIEDVIGISKEDIILASAKAGTGITEALEAIVTRSQFVKREVDKPLKALLLDSWYDQYRGVVGLIKVVEGSLKVRDDIIFMHSQSRRQVDEVSILTPKPIPVDKLTAGEVGIFTAAIRDIEDALVGDTITSYRNGTTERLPGFKEVKPMVFSGLFPVDSSDYESLRDALGKLRLNDYSFSYHPENSDALGFGFRCGFLGLLHMNIIQERLEREFGLNLITTAPNVIYKVNLRTGKTISIHSPSKLPNHGQIDSIEEPIIRANIILPVEYLGACMKLINERRGKQEKLEYLSPTRISLIYLLPLSEVALDFYDRLKTVSSGYASMDYELGFYQQANLVKLDLLVNGTPVDTLSTIVAKEKAHSLGKELAERMQKLIPRQMFDIIIQASIGGKIVARTTVKALRKNVLAKCYGGDVTRKRKLLEKQKEGKKRMKTVGRVDIPQEAFLAMLKSNI
ncbi:MAG: translation elongation factor 4 [Nitrospinota bacterium]